LIDLHDFGWNQTLEHARRVHSADLLPARVVAEHRSLYRVQAADAELAARTSGRLRHSASGRGDLPAVGDWVLITPGGEHQVAVIHHVLPRSSCFSRKAAGARTDEQVVAANIDVVWIAHALDQPLGLRRIERYLAVTWESGAVPVILLTKADLANDVERARVEVESVAIGVPVHVVSSATGSGVAALEEYVRQGRTVALLGPSGAGKSTLINSLLGAELLRVAAVRETDHKGRHTTTHRQLVRLPRGGLIVDTPGMRELQLWDAETGIQDTFAELEELAASCRFGNCTHTAEPGCAVIVAVECGLLDPGRLESYQKLAREQAYLARRHDARSQAEANRKIRIIMKSVRQHPKYRHRD
jgi:ribosome biogenesis GTPase